MNLKVLATLSLLGMAACTQQRLTDAIIEQKRLEEEKQREAEKKKKQQEQDNSGSSGSKDGKK